MKPRTRPSHSRLLRRPLLAAALLAALPTAGLPQEPAGKMGYFYVESNPLPFSNAYTVVLQARFRSFDDTRIRRQYQTAIERSFPEEDWSGYMHHARPYGPFASREEAEADRNERMAGRGRTLYHEQSALQIARRIPAQAFEFRYFDTVVTAVWEDDRIGELSDSWTESVERQQTALFELSRDAAVSVQDLPLTPPTDDWRRGYLGEHPPDLAVAVFDTPHTGDGLASFAARLAELAGLGAFGQAKLAVLDTEGHLSSSWSDLVARVAGNDGALAARMVLVAPPAPGTEAPTVGEQLKAVADELTRPLLPPLRINELLAKNDTAQADEAGENDDWVELYNPGSEPINVGGMYLSDDPRRPWKWKIPENDAASTTVPAGGHLVFWCDDQSAQGARHAGIKLSAGGEALLLVDLDGRSVIDRIDFGPQEPDRSYARQPDGGDDWQTGTPTFGTANSAAESP